MDELIESIYKAPEDWVMGTYRFLHRPTGLVVWVANGFWFLKVEQLGSDGYMSFMDKVRLHKAIKWWRKNVPLSSYAS